MSNESWDQELSEALRSIKPLQAPIDLRARVLQQIGSKPYTTPLLVRPLLPIRVIKGVLLAIPLLMGITYLLSLVFPSSSAPVFSNFPIPVPDIRMPAFTAHMSSTLQYAIMAALAFSCIQVIMIGRIWRRAGDQIR